jgi:drug/metabolite transporter (DMT)-like permease
VSLVPVALTERWNGMNGAARGAVLMSGGSITLVLMALLIKQLGTRIPAIEILFFRSFVGFLFVLPLFVRNPLEPFRTRRPGAHLVRGVVGTLGNVCFFWTITHMLLADAMALQFSRPLFMIPLAALVVLCIKWLAKTEPTRVIMFYYAFWTAVLSAVPAFLWWVTPTPFELMLLVGVGFLGILGQGMITQAWTQADAAALVTLDYSRILYAAIAGFLVFGEVPGVWSFAGMALIVGASLYLVLSEGRRARAG